VALGGCGGEPPLPTIVLVTIDTIRADHLGAYGYFRDTSPRLDAFAQEAILFERAYAPMATTLPSHLSLLNSAYPLRHRIRNNHQTVPAGSPWRTLPVLLRELGYETAAFVSALPLGAHSGIATGFDHFDEPEEIDRRAAATNARVLEWLDVDREGPLFLWIHYFDPHAEYDPPPPFDAAFETDDALRDRLEELRVSRRKMAKALDIHNRYDGEILYLDGRLGELFDELRARGHWEEAAVVVVGDHGEGLGQHDYVDHGKVWNEQLLVPLMIKLPAGNGPVGARSARVASLIDVVPTLVARLGLPVPEEDRARFEGVDLLDEGVSRDFVVAERRFPPRRAWTPGERWALVGERWKYIYSSERPDELYDLVEDPIEKRNLAEHEPEVTRRMAARLQEILATIEETAATEPGAPSPEAVEGLRALGYVD
jgi:arylsulfatase